VDGPQHGALTFNADGSYSYTPGQDYNGSDSFTFKANDGMLDSNVATVCLTINPVNDAPVADAGSNSGDEDHQIAGQLVATDVDNTPS
jgi:VCBS repeat-containing protein